MNDTIRKNIDKAFSNSYNTAREEGYTQALAGQKTQKYSNNSVLNRKPRDEYEVILTPEQKEKYSFKNLPTTQEKNFAGMTRNEELFSTLGIQQRSDTDFTAYSNWYKNNGNKHKAGFEEEGAKQLKKEQALYSYHYENTVTDAESYTQWKWDTFSQQVLNDLGYYPEDKNWWAQRVASGKTDNPLEDDEFLDKIDRKIDLYVNELGLQKLKDMPKQWEMMLESNDSQVSTTTDIEQARAIYNERLDAYSSQVGNLKKAQEMYQAKQLGDFDSIIYNEEGKAAFFLDYTGNIVTLTEDKSLAKKKGYGLVTYADNQVDDIKIGNGFSYGSGILEGFTKGIANVATDLVIQLPGMLVAGLVDIGEWMTGDTKESNLGNFNTWYQKSKAEWDWLANDDIIDVDGKHHGEWWENDKMWSDMSFVGGQVAGQFVIATATAGLGNAASAGATAAGVAGHKVTQTALNLAAKGLSTVSRLHHFSNGVVDPKLTMAMSSFKSAAMISFKGSLQNYSEMKSIQSISGWTDEEIATNTGVNFLINLGLSTALREVGSEGNNAYTRWKSLTGFKKPNPTSAFNKMLGGSSIGRFLSSEAGKYIVIGTAADTIENIATMASDSLFTRDSVLQMDPTDVPSAFVREMVSIVKDPVAMTNVVAGMGMQTWQALDFGMSDMIGRVNIINQDVMSEIDSRIAKAQANAKTEADLKALEGMVAVKNAYLKDLKPKDGEDAPTAILRALSTFNDSMKEGDTKTFIEDVITRNVEQVAKTKLEQRVALTKDMYYSTYMNQGAVTRAAFGDPAKFTKEYFSGGAMKRFVSQLSKLDGANKTAIAELKAYASSDFKDQLGIVQATDAILSNEGKGLADDDNFKVNNVAELEKTNPERYKELIKDHKLTVEEVESLHGGSILLTSNTAGNEGESSAPQKIRQQALTKLAEMQKDLMAAYQAEFPDQEFRPLIREIGQKNNNDGLFVIDMPLNGLNAYKLSNNITAFMKSYYEIIAGKDKQAGIDGVLKVVGQEASNKARGDLIADLWKSKNISTQDAIYLYSSYGKQPAFNKVTIPTELQAAVKFSEDFEVAVAKNDVGKMRKLVRQYQGDSELNKVLQEAKIVSPEDMTALLDLTKQGNFTRPEKTLKNLQTKLSKYLESSPEDLREEINRVIDFVFDEMGQHEDVRRLDEPLDVQLKRLESEGVDKFLETSDVFKPEELEYMASLETAEERRELLTNILTSIDTEDGRMKMAIKKELEVIDGLRKNTTSSIQHGDDNVVYVDLNVLTTKYRETIRKRASTDANFRKTLEENQGSPAYKLNNILKIGQGSLYQEDFYNRLLAANDGEGVLKFNLKSQEDIDRLDYILQHLGHDVDNFDIRNGTRVDGVFYSDSSFEAFEFKVDPANAGKLNRTQVASDKQAFNNTPSKRMALLNAYGDVMIIDDNSVISVNEIPRSAINTSKNARVVVGTGARSSEHTAKIGKLSKELSGRLINLFSSKAVQGEVDISMRNYLALEDIVSALEDKFGNGYAYPPALSAEHPYMLQVWGGNGSRFDADAARQLIATTPKEELHLVLQALVLTDAGERATASAAMYSDPDITRSGPTNVLLDTPYETVRNLLMDFDINGGFKRDLDGYLRGEQAFDIGDFVSEPLKINNMPAGEMLAELSKPEYANNINAIMLYNHITAMMRLSTEIEEAPYLKYLFDDEVLNIIGYGLDAGESLETISTKLEGYITKQATGPEEITHATKYTQGHIPGPNADSLSAVDLKRKIQVYNPNEEGVKISPEELRLLVDQVKTYVAITESSLETTLIRENPTARLNTMFKMNASEDGLLRVRSSDLYHISAEELVILKDILSPADYKTLENAVTELQKTAYEDAANASGVRQASITSKQAAVEMSGVGLDDSKESVQAKEAAGQLGRKLQKYHERMTQIKSANYHLYQQYASPLMDRYYDYVDNLIGDAFVHNGSLYLTNLDNKEALGMMVQDVAMMGMQLKEAGIPEEKATKLAFDMYVKSTGTQDDAEPIRYSAITPDGEVAFHAHDMYRHKKMRDADLYFNLLNNLSQMEPGSTIIIHDTNSNQLRSIKLTKEDRVAITKHMGYTFVNGLNYTQRKQLNDAFLGNAVDEQGNKLDGMQVYSDMIRDLVVSHTSKETLQRVMYQNLEAELNKTGHLEPEEIRSFIGLLQTRLNDVQAGLTNTKSEEALADYMKHRFGDQPGFYNELMRNKQIGRILDTLNNGISYHTLNEMQQDLLQSWGSGDSLLSGMRAVAQSMDAQEYKRQLLIDIGGDTPWGDAPLDEAIFDILYSQYNAIDILEQKRDANGSLAPDTIAKLELAYNEVNAFKAQYGELADRYMEAYRQFTEFAALREQRIAETKEERLELSAYLDFEDYKEGVDLPKASADSYYAYLKSFFAKTKDAEALELLFKDLGPEVEFADPMYNATNRHLQDTHYRQFNEFFKTADPEALEAFKRLREEAREKNALVPTLQFTSQQRDLVMTALNNLADLGNRRIVAASAYNQVLRSENKHRRMVTLFEHSGRNNLFNAVGLMLHLKNESTYADMATYRDGEDIDAPRAVLNSTAVLDTSLDILERLSGSKYGNLHYGDNLANALTAFNEVLEYVLDPSDTKTPLTGEKAVIAEEFAGLLDTSKSLEDNFKDLTSKTQAIDTTGSPANVYQDIASRINAELAERTPGSELTRRLEAAEDRRLAHNVISNIEKSVQNIVNGLELDNTDVQRLLGMGKTFYVENVEGRGFNEGVGKALTVSSGLDRALQAAKGLELGKSMPISRIWDLTTERSAGTEIRPGITMDSNTLVISKESFEQMFGVSYRSFQTKYPDNDGTFYAAASRHPSDKADAIHPYRIVVDDKVKGVQMTRDAMLSRHSGDFDGDHLTIYKPTMDAAEQRYFSELTDMNAKTYSALDTVNDLVSKHVGIKRDLSSRVIASIYSGGASDMLNAQIDADYRAIKAGTLDYADALETYATTLLNYVETQFGAEFAQRLSLDEKEMERLVLQTYIQRNETSKGMEGENIIYTTNNRNGLFAGQEYTQASRIKELFDASTKDLLLDTDKQTGYIQLHLNFINQKERTTKAVHELFGYVPVRLTDETRENLQYLSDSQIRGALSTLDQDSIALYTSLTTAGVAKGDAFELALQSNEYNTRKATVNDDFIARHLGDDTNPGAFRKSLTDFHNANKLAEEVGFAKNRWYGDNMGDSKALQEVLRSVAMQNSATDSSGLQERVSIEQLAEQKRLSPAKIAFGTHDGNADAVYVTEAWAQKNQVFQVYAVPKKVVEGKLGEKALSTDLSYEGRTIPKGTRVLDSKDGMVLLQSTIPMSDSTKIAVVGSAIGKAPVIIDNSKVPDGYDIFTSEKMLRGDKASNMFMDGGDFSPKEIENNERFFGYEMQTSIVEDTAYYKAKARETTIDTLSFNNSFDGLAAMSFWGGHYLRRGEDGSVTIDPSLTVDTIQNATTRPDMLPKNGVSYARKLRALTLAKYLISDREEQSAFAHAVINSPETANSGFEMHLTGLLARAGLADKTPAEVQEHFLKTYPNITSEELATLSVELRAMGYNNDIQDFHTLSESSLEFKAKNNPNGQINQAGTTSAPMGRVSQTDSVERGLKSDGDTITYSHADGFAPMRDVQRVMQNEINRLESERKGKKFFYAAGYGKSSLQKGTDRGLFNVGKGYGGGFDNRFYPQDYDDTVQMDKDFVMNYTKKNQKAGANAETPAEMYRNFAGTADIRNFSSDQRDLNLAHEGRYNTATATQGRDASSDGALANFATLAKAKNRSSLLYDLEGYTQTNIASSPAHFRTGDNGKVGYGFEDETRVSETRIPAALNNFNDAKTPIRDMVGASGVGKPEGLATFMDAIANVALKSTIDTEVTKRIKHIYPDFIPTENYKKLILELAERPNQGIQKSESLRGMEDAEMTEARELFASNFKQDMKEEAGTEDTRTVEDIKQASHDLLADEPATGDKVQKTKKVKMRKFGLERSGVVVDSKEGAVLDLIVNRALGREKRVGTMKALGENFTLASARLAQVGTEARKQFNKWVQVSAVLKYQKPEDIERLVGSFDFDTKADAEFFVKSFETAYPELVVIQQRMFEDRVRDFTEFNNEMPNEATMLHLYAPYAKEQNDIFHLQRVDEGIKGGKTNKISADRFQPSDMENFLKYDYLKNQVALAEHIAAKRAYAKTGKMLRENGFIDTATVRQSILGKFRDGFQKLTDEGIRLRGDEGALRETLGAIASFAESRGIPLSKHLDKNNQVTLRNMLLAVDGELNRIPEEQKVGYYELHKQRETWTPEQKRLADLYETELQLAHFAMQKVPGLAGDLTKEIQNLQYSGLVLVDSFGRKLDAINEFNGGPMSDIDAEHVKRAAYHGVDPLSAILTGDVGLMSDNLAKHLFNNVYHTKEKGIGKQVMQRIMNNAVRAIMSVPTKVASRLSTYTQSDIGLMAMSDIRAATKLPEARRELSAFLQSKGAVYSDDFVIFLDTMGLSPFSERGAGLDPIRFEEKREHRVPIASKYYDTIAELFEQQTIITRYALWKQMKQNIEKDGNYGNAYHRKAALSAYDEMYDAKTAAGYKAAYIVDNTMGAPGGFPLAARHAGQWLTFTTYPMALTRGTTESVRAMMAATKDSFTGNTSAMKSLSIPAGGSLGLYLMVNAINQALVSSYGNVPMGEDDDEDDAYKPADYMKDAVTKGAALDIPSTLWNGELIFNQGALMSPWMSMYEMFVEPWVETYPNGTPVDLDDKMLNAADTLLLGKLHPMVKMALETVMGKDLTGFGAQDRNPMLSETEHIMRKISGYAFGTKVGNQMFELAYQERLEDTDMSYTESLVRGFANAFAADMTNSKQFKYERYQHTEGRKIIDAWKYSSESEARTGLYNEDRSEFNNSLLLFDEDFVDGMDSKYNKDDVKRVAKVLDTLMKNEASPTAIYEQLVNFYEDGHGVTKESLRGALNRVSIIRKLNTLEDPEGFFAQLSEAERATIQQAIMYEKEMFPLMEDYLPYKESTYDPYVAKDYTYDANGNPRTSRSYGSGRSYYGRSSYFQKNYTPKKNYTPRLYTPNLYVNLPRSWDYYRKVKPKYRNNYTKNLYNNSYNKYKKSPELMEIGKKLYVNPMSETTNNKKAKVDNTSNNFYAQYQEGRTKTNLKKVRSSAKKRG